MRKKLDPKIQSLVNEGHELNYRSIFIVIGDRARY